jgi:hypothetical protein
VKNTTTTVISVLSGQVPEWQDNGAPKGSRVHACVLEE